MNLDSSWSLMLDKCCRNRNYYSAEEYKYISFLTMASQADKVVKEVSSFGVLSTEVGTQVAVVH